MMLRILVAIAVVGATYAATPASAKRFHIYKSKNSTQTVKSGGRGGKHYGERYGRTSH